MPVVVPEGVTVTLDGQTCTVKGPKGELKRTLPDEMKIEMKDGTVTVERPTDAGRHRALHGLTRSLVNNMVEGVTNGFTKQLEIEGIDKQMVGQVAAELRRVRPPEPYKGKGIRYQGEQVRRKAGKTGGKA
jgi:large subunit ribosomal protein L6